MGWESRSRQRDAVLIASRLEGLSVAIDVQHLYRASHPNDQGTVYTDAKGQHVTEAHLATLYAIAMADWFRTRGATVWTNETNRVVPGAASGPAGPVPLGGLLVGEYWTRNRQAANLGAMAYLACHVNAGGGRYAAVEYLAGTAGDRLAASILDQLPAAAPELVGSRTVALIPGARGAVCIESFHPGPLPAVEPRAAVILEPFFGDCTALRPLWAADRLQRIGWAIGEGVARWWENHRRAALIAYSAKTPG